jgi:hypothetical protein
VLGLIASTRKGAFILNHFGWESTRHSRKDTWPVIEEQDLARPDENCEETRGMVASLSSLSLARSEGSRAPRSRHSSSATYGKQASFDEFVVPPDDPDPASPASDVSPKATFFISKSRSNTMESGEFSFPGTRRGSDAAGRSRSGTMGSAVSFSCGAAEDSPDEGGIVLPTQASREGEGDVDDRPESESKNSSQYPASLLDSADKANGGLSITKHRSISAPSEKSTMDSVPVHGRSASEPVEPGAGDIKRNSSTEAMYRKTLRDNLKRKRSNTTATESDSSRSGDYQSVKSSSGWDASLDTDPTTSGIGSLESGPQMDYPKLSPIPSASSLNTTRPVAVSVVGDGSDEESKPRARSTVHPSDSIRRLANLKRIPSTKRRYSNPVLGPLSKSLGNNQDLTEEYTLSYTSMQDAHGLAALRDIKSKRTISMAMDAEQSMTVITEEPTSMLRTKSLANFSIRKSA